MKYLILMALTFCSCSQTTVHLYARYLTDAQKEVIDKQLVTADFVVKPNQLQFPDSVTQSSLTYSPLIKDPNAVHNVLAAMHDIGWDIHNTRMLFTDNHWYKENSIALMLVPPNVDPQALTNQQDWANEYISQNCDLDLIIRLEIKGQYQILTTDNSQLKKEYATGKWSISDFPYLELRAKDSEWEFFFELKNHVKTDQLGDIQISELAPMSHYPAFAGCSFVYGVRL